jgi:hypothetical protein
VEVRIQHNAKETGGYRRKGPPALIIVTGEQSLGIPQAGFHAFRHFNVSLLDALNTPLKVIQERAGHALTGSFTLDVYGGKPEWIRNVEAAHKAGKSHRDSVKDVEEAEKPERFVSLTAIQENSLSTANAQAIENV